MIVQGRCTGFHKKRGEMEIIIQDMKILALAYEPNQIDKNKR